MSEHVYHREAESIWYSLGRGFSCISQRVLPPWDLITEYVMHYGQAKVSHQALCVAAFFGEGMVEMPSEEEIRILWDENPISFRCRPNAHDARDRYITYILLKLCSRETILRMRRHVNTVHTEKGIARPLPQFEMLYHLVLREINAAAGGNSKAVYEDILSVPHVMSEICRFELCPVEP